MRNPRLTAQDWEEIFYALESKANEIETGAYDELPGEIAVPNSDTARWASDLRRIMRRVGAT